MSNHLSAARGLLQSLLAGVLPQQCFACGAESSNGVLCASCLADLPGLATNRCPSCGIGQLQGLPCGDCLTQKPPFDATRAVLDYSFPVDRLVHALKYAHRLTLTRLFVDLLGGLPVPAADLVLPMPLHPARLQQRGFNQAAELARPLARRWGLPVLVDGVVRDLDTAPQAGLPPAARLANVRGAFRVVKPLAGLHIVVVDDVMTTGATLAELARALKAAGAQRVENRVLARTPERG